MHAIAISILDGTSMLHLHTEAQNGRNGLHSAPHFSYDLPRCPATGNSNEQHQRECSHRCNACQPILLTEHVLANESNRMCKHKASNASLPRGKARGSVSFYTAVLCFGLIAPSSSICSPSSSIYLFCVLFSTQVASSSFS
jgi:hypothetical protein